MIVRGNMLAQAKVYAENKWDGAHEQSVACHGYIEGYKAGYDQTYREWHKYAEWMERQVTSIQWHRVLLAFALGILVSKWLG